MRRITLVMTAVVCSALTIAHSSLAETPPKDAPLPGPVTNVLSLLAQTAAVVEGTVDDLTSEYTDETGPWTRIELSSVVVHLGSLGKQTSKTLVLRQRGGDYPDGRVMTISDMPRFVKKARYVVLLRNTAWNFSPFVGDVALRVDQVAEVEALVTTEGVGVLGYTEEGIKYSEPFFPHVDLAGTPPLQLSDVNTPNGLIGRAAFIAQTAAQLDARGMTLSGVFYDEPASRSREIPTEPSKNDQAK